MDNTIECNNGLEVYESDIHQYLDEYILTHDIEDMRKEPQSRWNAALLYINKYVFKGKKYKLLSKPNIYNNIKNNNPTNNGAYDLNIINYICDIYISLCYEYDKEISILGFSKLIGINQDTFFDWGNGSSRSSSSACEIYKKLTTEREETLSNRLYAGKANPVGILGILNRHYGWNMGQPRGQQTEQRQTIEQIQERYKMSELTDNSIQIEPPKADF